PSLNSTYWSLFEAAGGPENVAAILGRPHGYIGADDGSAPAGLRFDCALKLRTLDAEYPEPMRMQSVPGGNFLLTRHIGAYDKLPDAVDRLLLAALAVPELAIADEPMLFHYIDDPETTEEAALRTDVYLKISD
ncbi:MAG: GyrI-like domain-containing protein, partial [Pseudomonadota bacterium]